MATINIDPAPQEGAWGVQWKNWLSKLRDKIVAYFGVIDLTSATSDYTLGVGQVAKIDITAASTPLNIAVEAGWYEMVIQFNQSTFAADQSIELRCNNTTYAGAFGRKYLYADQTVATDEIDVGLSSDNAVVMGTQSPQRLTVSITIFGDHRTFEWRTRSITSANTALRFGSTQWNSATVYTSLGTLQCGEACTGVCYVRRLA